MKTIMILGGGPNQLPLLAAAKQRGYRIALCDYKEDNPGRGYADVFYCVSTLDCDAVLAAARTERPDGIITNSEPAMKVAAYAAHALGLPCNPPEIIAALSRKDLFRALLREKGLPVPGVVYADTLQQAQSVLEQLHLPVMVKPVDSSGSRGVTKLTDGANLPAAFARALEFSRMGRVIVEEFIENSHLEMIGGDIFVSGGRVVFSGLMDCLRDGAVNPYVPVGKRYPATLTAEEHIRIGQVLERTLRAFGISFGAFNMELMLGTNGQIYFIEMNPRNGGNHIPELLGVGTGFDIYDATVAAAVGETIAPPADDFSDCFFATQIVHSVRDGVLRSVCVDPALKPCVTDYYEERKPGEPVERFENADKLIGILFLHFENRAQMDDLLARMNQLVTVELEED